MYRNNYLFKGLDFNETERALSFFKAKTKKYKKGEIPVNSGEEMSCFGIVISGLVHVCNDDLEGNRVIMADVRPSESFGESLCYLRIKESPVYIITAQDCEIMWLSTDNVNNVMLKDAFSVKMNERFISLLAKRTLSMNSRIQILSKKTIREKVMMLLLTYSEGRTKQVIDIPFDRENMADFLGVDRTALSRELSKMKEDGIIDFHKSSFRIK